MTPALETDRRINLEMVLERFYQPLCRGDSKQSGPRHASKSELTAI